MISRVYVELDYYDGPLSGISELHNKWIRFDRPFDDDLDEYSNLFRIAFVEESEALLEIEQWNIFVKYYNEFSKGIVTTEMHPANGGIDARWDDLNRILVPLRSGTRWEDPKYCGEIVSRELGPGYFPDGPSYGIIWKQC
jgi:hypothetical protein